MDPNYGKYEIFFYYMRFKDGRKEEWDLEEIWDLEHYFWMSWPKENMEAGDTGQRSHKTLETSQEITRPS